MRKNKGLVTILCAALILGGVGYMSNGFKDWNADNWRNRVIPSQSSEVVDDSSEATPTNQLEYTLDLSTKTTDNFEADAEYQAIKLFNDNEELVFKIYSVTAIGMPEYTGETAESAIYMLFTFTFFENTQNFFNDDYSLNYDLSIKVSDLTLADHILSTTTDENGVMVTLDNYFDYNFSTLTITLTEKNA